MSIIDHADYLLSFFASVFPLQASRTRQRWSEASGPSRNQKPVLLLKYTAFFGGFSAGFSIAVLVYTESLNCCNKICELEKHPRS